MHSLPHPNIQSALQFWPGSAWQKHWAACEPPGVEYWTKLPCVEVVVLAQWALILWPASGPPLARCCCIARNSTPCLHCAEAYGGPQYQSAIFTAPSVDLTVQLVSLLRLPLIVRCIQLVHRLHPPTIFTRLPSSSESISPKNSHADNTELR